jgi:general stress protein YciG
LQSSILGVVAAMAPVSPDEEVSLDGALRRYLAADAMALEAPPPKTCSAMDGYAILASDVQGPRALPVVQTLHAGDAPREALRPGSAARIFTGATLPRAPTRWSGRGCSSSPAVTPPGSNRKDELVRLRVRPAVSSVRASTSERTVALERRGRMAKSNRRSRSRRGGPRVGSSRSAAGRKGGMATLRARGPEFYSEIGRKGGKSRGKSRRAGARPARRASRGASPRSRRSRGSRTKSR